MIKQCFKPLTVLMMLIGVLTACTSTASTDGDPIEFSGAIVSIATDTIVVGGFTVDISNAAIPTNLQIGDTVRVTGIQQPSAIVAVVVALNTGAEVVVATVPNDDAPTESPTDVVSDVTPTDAVVDASPIAETSVPNEVTQAPTVASTTVAQNPDVNTDEPLIVVEGPVQEITINTVRIFDIDIQVDPADPVLTEIRIGDTIRIQGVSSIENNVIIIVAINITIVQTSVIIVNNPVYVVPGIPANCRVKRSGKITCKNSRGSGSRRS